MDKSQCGNKIWAGITAYAKELRPRLRMESPLVKIQKHLVEEKRTPMSALVIDAVEGGENFAEARKV